MLEIKDLVISYGAIEAVKGIKVTVNQGEIVTPVSYTHLDVYKRQVVNRNTMLGRWRLNIV